VDQGISAVVSTKIMAIEETGATSMDPEEAEIRISINSQELPSMIPIVVVVVVERTGARNIQRYIFIVVRNYIFCLLK